MMEMVQMMEFLLARMEAKMDSNQKKAEADRDELKAKLDSNQEKAEARMAKFEEKMAANRKAKQEEFLAEISTRMDANMTKMVAIQSELEETIKHQMQQLLSYVDKSTRNLPEATKIEPDPEMMQFVEEHQEVPREEAANMPVKGLKKRYRVRNLAAERHQKLKERTRGYCGSQKRVTVAARRTFRHAKLA
jgi:hypothetical protein